MTRCLCTVRLHKCINMLGAGSISVIDLFIDWTRQMFRGIFGCLFEPNSLHKFSCSANMGEINKICVTLEGKWATEIESTFLKF